MPDAALPASPAARNPPGSRFWSDVRAALVGTRQDYTRGSVPRSVLLLAIPMVLEMSMQALFSIVDVYFVGKLGSNAVAIVGLTDSLLALVFSVAIGLSMGAAAMVARRIGEGDSEQAATTTVQALGVGIAVSLPFSVLGILYAPQLLQLLGADAGLAAEGRVFTAIMLGGNATVVLLFVINAIFRGAGDPSIAMRALWLANLLNIALDPLLIFGWGPVPAFGLAGAAIATTLARAIGVSYQLACLRRSGGRLRIEGRHLRLQLDVMRRLVRISAIGVLQFTISTVGFVWLFRILSVFGAGALAGYTIAVRIIIFVLLPAWGMGNAAATLVGQNLGAGNPARAERAVWLTCWYNAAFLGGVALLLLGFAEPLVSIFSREPEVVALAAQCLRIVSYSYVFWGFGMITVLAFNGAGDTTTPTWMNFFAYWAFQIPLAWLLAVHLDWGPAGVFTAIAAGQCALAAMGVTWFRRGTWKHRKV